MSGNINPEINNSVRVQESSVSTSSNTQSSLATSKLNTVFDALDTLTKKKRVLTPEELSKLLASGLDPSRMTEDQINTALITSQPSRTAKVEPAPAPTGESPEVPAPTTSAQAPETETAPVANAPAVPQAETQEAKAPEVPVKTEAELKAGSKQTAPETLPMQAVATSKTKDTQVTQDGVEIPEIKDLTKEVKPLVEEKTSKKEAAKVDFNNTRNKCFYMDPNKTGVFACDFAEMPKEEQEQFFLTQFTKFQYGEAWGKMSEKEQANAMTSVNKQLEEKVPSWSKLSPKGKAQLAKSFTMGTMEYESRGYTDTKTLEKSLDVVLEEISNKIVKKEEEEAKIYEFTKNFSAELVKFAASKPKYKGKTQEELNKTGEINDVMYDYLKKKVRKNGGDTSVLNENEKKIYAQLDVAKKLLPCGELKHLGGYEKEGALEAYLEKQDDGFASQLAQYPKGSEEYKCAFRTHLYMEYKSGGPDACASRMSAYMKHGSMLDKTMILEIYSGLPEKVQRQIKLSTKDAIRNLGNAKAEGDPEKSADALHNVTVVAAAEGNKEVVDNSIENANEIIENSEIANKSIIEGLKIGGADGYKAGVENGKITAEQVDIIAPVILDKKNNEAYSQEVQNAGVDTIGHSTVEKRENLIDLAVDNDRTTQRVAEKFDTFGEDFQVPTAGKLKVKADNSPKEQSIKIMNAVVDTNTRCSAENQLAIHKVVLQSKYNEVLEYAASNINKYAESVQADAIKATYATGNKRAVDACNNQIDQCSQKAVSSISKEVETSRTQTQQRQYQAASDKFAEVTIANNKITHNVMESEDVKVLSDADKQKHYAEMFKSALPQEQYRLLSKLPKDQLKEIMSKLCRAGSSVIKGLVAQGLGIYVLQTVGKSPDILYMTIDIMIKKGGKDAKYASEYVLSNKSLTHFSDDTIKKAASILGKEEAASIPESETKAYTSNPSGFLKNALRPGMSAVYPGKKELFFRA